MVVPGSTQYDYTLYNSCGNRHWTRKQLHPDSIWDLIQIRIKAADSIPDSIRTKISNS